MIFGLRGDGGFLITAKMFLFLKISSPIYSPFLYTC